MGLASGERGPVGLARGFPWGLERGDIDFEPEGKERGARDGFVPVGRESGAREGLVPVGRESGAIDGLSRGERGDIGGLPSSSSSKGDSGLNDLPGEVGSESGLSEPEGEEIGVNEKLLRGGRSNTPPNFASSVGSSDGTVVGW